jgi:hypothetical protein
MVAFTGLNALNFMHRHNLTIAAFDDYWCMVRNLLAHQARFRNFNFPTDYRTILHTLVTPQWAASTIDYCKALCHVFTDAAETVCPGKLRSCL